MKTTTRTSALPALHLFRARHWLTTALLVGAAAALSPGASAQSAAAPSASGADARNAPAGDRPGMHGGGRGGMHEGRHGMQGGSHHGMHGGMHHGMHGGMGGRMQRGMGPEGMFRGSPERMNRRIDRMLDGLGTSDAQRAQIKQIAAAAATDLRSQAEQGKGLREQSMRIFTAPQVDVAGAEQLRQQQMQQRDRMSRRATQAMVDASQVLTPEQRTKLGDRMRDAQARRADRMKRMSGAHGERR